MQHTDYADPPSAGRRERKHHQPPLQPIDPSRAKPALLAQNAVGRIPRWLLWSLSVVYALAGFIGRQPWQGQDIESFGIMQFMAAESLRIQDVPGSYVGSALQPFTALPYWLGALTIRALHPLQPWVSSHMAVQYISVITLLLTFVLVWYACYHLARTADAQPLPFALGGEAKPTDYARSLADAAVLAFMACLGLLQIGHEHTPSLWLLLCASLWLAGMATQSRHSRQSLVALGCAYIGLGLGGSLTIALLLCATAVALLLLWRKRAGLIVWHLAFFGMAWVALLWIFSPALSSAGSPFSAFSPFHFQYAQHHNAISIGKLLVWFGWPAAFLALMALWKWRGWWRSPHIAMPALMASVITLYAIVTHGSGFDAQRLLLLALPAIACLASFALPTAARDFTALIDWFALIFFCICGLAIWVVWLSLQTGFPEQPARNVQRLISDYRSVFLWQPFVLALLASAAWLWLVYWRVGKHRSAIWKSIALPAGGTALCWLLLTTLWLPMLNQARGYRAQIHALNERISLTIQPPPASASGTASGSDSVCAYYHGLTADRIIALHHYSKIHWQPAAKQTGDACGLLVMAPGAAHNIHQLIGEQLWELQTIVQHPTARGRRHDGDLLLYRRPAWQPLPQATAAHRQAQ